MLNSKDVNTNGRSMVDAFNRKKNTFPFIPDYLFLELALVLSFLKTKRGQMSSDRAEFDFNAIETSFLRLNTPV